jgi:hypothetical protein
MIADRRAGDAPVGVKRCVKMYHLEARRS